MKPTKSLTKPNRVIPANLPPKAYDGLTSGLEYYAQKAGPKRTKWCPNHVTIMIDDKYDVCYRCYEEKRG